MCVFESCCLNEDLLRMCVCCYCPSIYSDVKNGESKTFPKITPIYVTCDLTINDQKRPTTTSTSASHAHLHI